MLLQISLFLHVMAAIFWIGGMLFLVFVIAPFLASLDDPKKKSEIYQVVGKRFRFLGWIAIITLLVTGPINLYYMGVTPALIFDPEFHATPYGQALMIKIAFVLLIVASSLLHDFWVGPGARKSKKMSRAARIMGRGNLLLALIVVVFAVLIRLGG